MIMALTIWGFLRCSLRSKVYLSGNSYLTFFKTDTSLNCGSDSCPSPGNLSSCLLRWRRREVGRNWCCNILGFAVGVKYYIRPEDWGWKSRICRENNEVRVIKFGWIMVCLIHGRIAWFHLFFNWHFSLFFSRWFIVHVGFVRFLRQMFFVTNVGPSPPAILRLSDGGHIENLAILPLLKKRLKKIVVVDGGHKESDQEWGDSLLKALSLARQKLKCSFIALDGRDVIEDLEDRFVNKPLRHQPRSYRLATNSTLSHHFDKNWSFF